MRRLAILYFLVAIVATMFIGSGTGVVQAAGKIVHDAEYYILEAQNGEKWAADDKAVDAKLSEFRAKNGGKPPNILYILIDDIGFGDLGIALPGCTPNHRAHPHASPS
jgi:arylsulfatase